MPCTKDLNIDTSTPVMVTGATGYVAGVLISRLLDYGLTIHATVRDPTKKDRLQYLEDCAAKSKGSIKFFSGNLLERGSFDEAAKNCSIIFHTASPFVLTVDNVDKDLLEPAVGGTENVLTTANNTPTVTRVVLTSSAAAIFNHASDLNDIPDGVWTEEIWNRGSTKTDSPYSLSKTMAEQKAWVMAGSQTQWKLVVINPTFVMGPGLKYHPTSESFQLIKKLGSGEVGSMAPAIPFGLVDVRDVADGHIAAAFLPEAAGRHIFNGTNGSLVSMSQAIAEKFAPPKHKVPTKEAPVPNSLLWAIAPWVGMSRTFAKENLGYKMNFDNSKATNELGIDFYPLSKTMQEMYQQLLDEKIIEVKD